MPDVNALILKSRYNEAISLAKKQLRKLPHYSFVAHWYYAHICEAYYEKRNYKRALWWGNKAVKTHPNCPMVLWYIAGPLYQLDYVEDAIDCFKSIYDRGLSDLADGDCGEGRRRAAEMRSDCRIRLAECYYAINDLKNALKWGKLFLRYFHHGGIVKRKFGEKLVRRYEKEIENDRKASRKIK